MYIPAWPCLSPAHLFGSATREPLPYPLNSQNTTYFYVARNGIYHLMRSLGLDKPGTVLAPDYHHGNEIFAMRAAGANIRYYPIRRNLEVDLDVVAELCKKTRTQVLYVTHFIGWPQPMAELQALCRDEGIILIEDCALSFLSEVGGKPLGTFGEHSVFCLYKSLPLPNGGILSSNSPLPLKEPAPSTDKHLELRVCSNLSVAGRSAELMLQWVRSRHDNCGRVLFALKRAAGCALSASSVRKAPVGDTGFDISRADMGMSPICHTLIRNLSYTSIRETRRRNFNLLQQRLAGKVSILDLPSDEGICPLFFPLLVKDKKLAAHALWRQGIGVVEFWNNGDPEARYGGSHAEFLRRHLLEVPIHQDVTDEAVNYVADQVLKLDIGLPDQQL